jgi:phosphonopyruvate decarboxylase
MLLLIGWRGEPGTKDEPQHMKQGRVTPALLDAMGIPYGVIGPEWEETVAALSRAFECLRKTPAPCALLVRKGCFETESAVPVAAGRGEMTREEAIWILVESSDDRTVFVASTGMGSRELYEVREARGEPHRRDFLNVGAMGHASMIAAGAAIGRRNRRVVCLDGDGALLMHMGVMPLIPSLGLDAFVHVVLNNGTHDSVGGQPNAAMRADMAGIARAAGYDRVFDALTGGDVRGALHTAFEAGGTTFLNIAVKEGHRTDLGRPSVSLIEAVGQFREFLRFSRDADA